KGVVHHVQRTGVMGDLCDRLHVGDLQQRVGGGLTPNDLGLGTYRRTHRLDVALVDRVPGHTPALDHLGDQSERTAVGVSGDDHVVTGGEHGTQEGVLGRHAGGKI